MSGSDRQRYKALLEKACRDEGAGDDLAARERIYGRMRELNEDLLRRRGANLGPERAGELRRLLGEVLEEDRGAAQARRTAAEAAPPALREPIAAAIPAAAMPRPPVRGRLATMAAGAALGVAAVFVASWAIAPAETSPATGPAPPKGVTPPASWQKLYDASLPKVTAASAFLERVRDAVDDRQMEDGVALTTVAGGGFVPLDAVLPELQKQFPKALRGSKVTLRADGVGYKILMDWQLCATVQIAKPEMVDPVRRKKVPGCSHFGVWNETGAKW